jgi:predicted RND superfamily exporter protein
MISNKSITEKYISLLYRRPKIIFFISLISIIALCGGLTKIQANYAFRELSATDDPKLAVYDLFEKHFGNDDSVNLILHNPKGIFNKETLRFIGQATEALKLMPEAMRVESLFEGNLVSSKDDTIEVTGLVERDKIDLYTESELGALADKTLSSPQISSYLLSKDKTISSINIYLIPSKYYTVDNYKFSVEVENIISKIPKPDGLEVHYSGPVYVQKAMIETSKNDQQKLFPIILLLFSLIAYVSFKSVVGVLILMFVIIINILCALGLQGYLGYPINAFTSPIPIIITTITTGGLIHLLAGFYRSYRATGDKIGSLLKTYHHNFTPILFTSITTSAGFFSLSNKTLMPVYQLGVTIGFATMISWYLLVTFLGPLLLFIHKQKVEPQLDEKGIPQFAHDKDKDANTFSFKYVAWIKKYKNTIIISWIIAVLLSLLTIPSLRITMNPFMQYSENHPIVKTKNLLMEKMGFTIYTELLIDSGIVDGVYKSDLLKRVEAFEKEMITQENLAQNISVITLLKEMNKILNQNDQQFYRVPDSNEAVAQYLLLYSMSDSAKIKSFISEDGRYLKSMIFTHLEESDRILEQMDRIETLAQKYNLNLEVTGKLPLFMGLGAKVFGVIGSSSIISLSCICLIMFLFIRNVKLGILSMIPNVVPLLLGASILKFLDFGIDVSSTLIFSVCLGVAVDDTIHFIHHWLSLKKQGKTPEEILAHITVNLFPMIISTTLLLSIGFSVLAFGLFLPTVKFGILCACVLTLAMLADLLLLPAILLKKRLFD